MAGYILGRLTGYRFYGDQPDALPTAELKGAAPAPNHNRPEGLLWRHSPIRWRAPTETPENTSAFTALLAVKDEEDDAFFLLGGAFLWEDGRLKNENNGDLLPVNRAH